MNHTLQQLVTSRFGIFIHFGLYSIPGGIWNGKPQGRGAYAEWIRYNAYWPEPRPIPEEDYNALATQFTCTDFNAELWAQEIKNAGAGYVIITAKHHDGFALFDSQVSSYNVVAQTPFGRDLIGELADACRRQGILFGVYYSHWQDWHHPGGALPHWPEIPGDPTFQQPADQDFEDYFNQVCLPQVTELLDRYSVRLFWFDSWKQSPFLTEKRLNRLMDLVHSRGAILNSRVGVTWNHPLKDEAPVDYLSMMDNCFPEALIRRPWETSGTMNHSWGYNQMDNRWLSLPQLLLNLVKNVSRNGNYQLNVGPLPTGAFPPAAIRRLREIGAWMAVNGQAVRNCGPAELPEPKWGFLTKQLGDGRIFATVFNEPEDGILEICWGDRTAPSEIVLLETLERLEASLADGVLKITLPPEHARLVVPVIQIS